MRYIKTISVALACLASIASAQQTSPDDAKRLFTISRNLSAPVELQGRNLLPHQLDHTQLQRQLRLACLNLEAAVALHPENAPAWRDLLTLYTDPAINEHENAEQALNHYLRLQPQSQPILQWINYRLAQLNDRAARENFLRQSHDNFREFPQANTHILTLLGILALEKGLIDDILDPQGEPEQRGARSYFLAAHKASLYNDEPLARLLLIGQPPFSPDPTNTNLTPDQQRLRHDQQWQYFSILRWRVRLLKNPYDLDATQNLIQTLETFNRFAYAQTFYEHAANILKTLPQSQNILRQLRADQLNSAYAGQQYLQAVTIAQKLLVQDPHDALVQGMLAHALDQLGMTQQARDNMQQATQNANTLSQDPNQRDPHTLTRLAWFFSLINPQPQNALNLAQKALQKQTSQQNTPAQHLLAYAHLLNKQHQQAQTLLQNADPNLPLVALTLAQSHLDLNQPDQAQIALDNLRIPPTGILAQHLRQLHQKLPAPPKTPPLPNTQPTPTDAIPEQPDPAQPDQQPAQPQQPQDPVLPTLDALFTNNDLHAVTQPQSILKCSISLPTDIFQVGDNLLADLELANISDLHDIPTPVVLGPASWINPELVLAARIQPGPQTPIIIARRNLATNPLLQLGQRNKVTEAIDLDRLHHLLRNHPQQTYKITLYATLDPQLNPNGALLLDQQTRLPLPRIPAIQPQPVHFTRQAFQPTTARMASYLRDLRNGSPRTRVRATAVIAALLRENQQRLLGRTTYPLVPIDATALRNIIAKNLNHTDFRVRTASANALQSLTLNPNDPETQTLVKMLRDDHWLCRFTALATLEPVANLTEYYEWARVIETHPLIQRQLRLFQDLPWLASPTQNNNNNN